MRKQEEILVSVCCLTYNQEKYVRDVIEGFLSQKQILYMKFGFMMMRQQIIRQK